MALQRQKSFGTKMPIQLNRLLLLASLMMVPNFVYPQLDMKTSETTPVSHVMVRDKFPIQPVL